MSVCMKYTSTVTIPKDAMYFQNMSLSLVLIFSFNLHDFIPIFCPLKSFLHVHLF